MAKDRNTFAKRQRELEKKRKADQKRERRAKKKQTAHEFGEPNKSQFSLSPEEHAVLSVFRKWLVTPGKMLCFATSDLKAFHLPLAQLTHKGLVVAEKFQGGYSLTESGFAAMNEMASSLGGNARA